MGNQEKSLVKKVCICCQEQGKPTNKEHIFPQWILRITNTFNNPIKGTAGAKRIPGKHCVIPICEDCNSEFGRLLETPVSRIFRRIEAGKGFNDLEAELLVRWMWKITGMFYWIKIAETIDDYGFVNLKEKCLTSIEQPRDRISVAVSLIRNVASDNYVDTPMGIDVIPRFSNVLAAGVFNKVVIVVYYTKFDNQISPHYTRYKLSKFPKLMNPNKKIKPKYGFENGVGAIKTTIDLVNSKLLTLHEKEAIINMKECVKGVKNDDQALPDEFKEYINEITN